MVRIIKGPIARQREEYEMSDPMERLKAELKGHCCERSGAIESQIHEIELKINDVGGHVVQVGDMVDHMINNHLDHLASDVKWNTDAITAAGKAIIETETDLKWIKRLSIGLFIAIVGGILANHYWN